MDIIVTIVIIVVVIILLVWANTGERDKFLSLLANVITIVGGIATIWFILSPRIASPPEPTPEPTSPPPTQEGTSNEENWAISFEHRFPARYWTVGSHQYTIDLLCSSITDDNDKIVGGNWTVNFEVNEDAELFPTPLYLRLSGVRSGKIEGESVESIHPDQETIGILTLANSTREEAELPADDCNMTFQWDDTPPQVLVPKEIFQH